MGLFSKEGKKAHGLPRAGCGSITEEQVYAIVEDGFSPEEASTVERFFYMGFLSALQFVAIEEGSGDMYGKTAREFADNGFEIAFDKILSSRLKHAAQAVFEEFGVATSVAGVGLHMDGGEE